MMPEPEEIDEDESRDETEAPKHYILEVQDSILSNEGEIVDG